MTIQTSPDRPMGSMVSVNDLLAAHADETAHERTPDARFTTGMFPLDDVLLGGFRPQDLVLIGGRPGAGKTIMALQWARNIAMQGAHAIYVCYGHSAEDLLERFSALEELSAGRDVRIGPRELNNPPPREGRPDRGLSGSRSAGNFERVAEYGKRLSFVTASGRYTDVDALDRLIPGQDHRDTVVFVDYLQKIPTRGSGAASEDDRLGYLAEALKDLAMRRKVAVVALAAADRQALGKRRLRMHDLRGSSALGYEADVVLILNEKARALSKSHLAFDGSRAELVKRQLIVSVEKQRRGPAGLDIEFRKEFASHAIDPVGTFLAEDLLDDVLFPD